MSQTHFIPVTTPIVPSGTVETLAQKFCRLATKWKEEGRFMSKTKDMKKGPAYREIVAMGEAAVPLILADLE